MAGGGSGGGPDGGGQLPDGGMPSGGWTNVTANLAGMASECGNMSFVSAHPDRDLVIAGIARKGLWAAADGATTWTQLGQGAGSAVILNRPGSIVYDPMHPNTFWEVGIYNGDGAFRTTDNGMTFTKLGNATHHDHLGVDFTDPARMTLLAGSHEQVGRLLKSIDGGATWMDIGPMLPGGAGVSAIPHVIDGQTYLLGSYQSPGAGIFRTTNGGAQWTKVYEGAVRNRPLVASDGAMYWMLDSDGGVVRSTDKGVTWMKVGGMGMISTALSGSSGSSIVELPDGRLAYMSRQRLVTSADKGVTWTAIGPNMPYTPWGLAYSRARKAFYIWKFSCASTPGEPVPAEAIFRLGFE
jgi:photosystem II stability/assembly factor-like uncharacterized protein